MTDIRIFGLAGSLRRLSFNAALLRAAAELAPAGMQIDIGDLRDIPPYDDDVRAEAYPDEVERLVGAMQAADGLLFVTPEYNRSIPGVLKNAIDWASRRPDQPFDRKPVAIMRASRGVLGTIMANHHLRQILVYLNARTVAGPEVLVGEAPKKFDADLNLVDEPTRDFVRAHLVRLGEMVAEPGR